MTTSFSKRLGYVQENIPDIIVREDAPQELRGYILNLAVECNFNLDLLRDRVCLICHKRKDLNNWSASNIENEIQGTLDRCTWYYIYDLIESIALSMQETPYSYDFDKFTEQVNSFFITNGIGWQLVDAKIEIRGSKPFEDEIKIAKEKLKSADLHTSYSELSEARKDLSSRPTPDITGAIQHAVAALECTARKIKDSKATLGDLVKKHTDLLPPPLDTSVSKLWGFASEYARHVQEDKQLATIEDAELVVGISAVIINYLLNKKSLENDN